MTFNVLDGILIALVLLSGLFFGLKFRGKSGKTMESFLLGGRSLPWYVAGASMVATTFAADTPLIVAEIVANNGVSGNWIWWCGLIGGMFTTFFFATLWRRAGVLTEVELIELRYSGKAAKSLRGVKAVYLGGIMNLAILCWVNAAMITILEVCFGWSTEWIFVVILLLMLWAALYTSLGGMLGVAMTDMVQFGLAMVASIALAVFIVQDPSVGGLSALVDKLPESTLSFFPTVGGASDGVLALSIGAFVAFACVQWWSSWYPGSEPGGGGYVVQRIMSARSEKDAVYSSLLFQFAHIAIRPWPWILVALCALIIYPQLMAETPKEAYVQAMVDYLPAGFKGLMFASILAAYLSTISTQLNWGAGYLVHDFYSRFLSSQTSEVSSVKATRVCIVVLALLSAILAFQVTTITSVWEFVLECGAGLGFVLIARWFWYRINAWTEIAATVAPFLFYSMNRWIPYTSEQIDQKIPFFITVILTILVSIVVAFCTSPESEEQLRIFYNRVQPKGWWKGAFSEAKSNKTGFSSALLGWLFGCVGTFSVLFGTGFLLFGQYRNFGICLAVFGLSFWIVKRALSQMFSHKLSA